MAFSNLMFKVTATYCLLACVWASASSSSSSSEEDQAPRLHRAPRKVIFARPKVIVSQPVEYKFPRFGNASSAGNETVYHRLGGGSEEPYTANQLSTATECGVTYVVEAGHSVLLYSRHDLYAYSCNQTFQLARPDTSDFHLHCVDFSLRFNCYFESFTVVANGTEAMYCRDVKVPDMSSKEFTLSYKRNVLGFNGGYVCFLTAVDHDTGAPAQVVSAPQCDVSVNDNTRSLQNDHRIVGGQNANRGEFKSQVQLKMKVGRYGYEYRCGGSLITGRTIVTAAHCLYGYSINKIEVGLGVYDTSASSEADSLWVDTQNYVVHEYYDDNLIKNDIALVILDEAVTFTDYIFPVCLPPAGLVVDGKVEATGWGALSYGGHEATILQKVELDSQTNPECQSDWRSKFSDNSFQIFDSQMCAMSPGKDTCSGDSGGPLLYTVGDVTVLVGVTSFGYRCADPDVGGVYSRVTEYLQWINDNKEE